MILSNNLGKDYIQSLVHVCFGNFLSLSFTDYYKSKNKYSIIMFFGTSGSREADNGERTGLNTFQYLVLHLYILSSNLNKF